MDEIQELTDWLVANADKKGTPEYGDRFSRMRELRTQETSGGNAAPAAAPGNWATTVKKYPEADIRRSIEEQYPPGARREKALQDWANAVVQGESTQGGSGVGGAGDYIRSIARGVPGGSWADELNAGTYGIANKLGLTDKTHDEVLAYQRARDKYFGRENPVADTSMQFAGGMAMPYLRGAGVPRNVAYNAVLGGIQGGGEGEGTDRISNAGTNAALSGGAALLFGPTGAYFDRYHRGNVDPAIETAAGRLGVNTPYFVRANDPIAQAEGRRTAQTRIGSPANLGYEDMRAGYDTAGEGVVRRVTGTGPEQAPYAAGQTVQPAMQQVAAGAGQASGQLAEGVNRLVPPGARMDPTATRGAVQDIVTQRGEVNPESQFRGLDDALSAVTNPQGLSWEGSSRFTTDVGKRLGVPDLSPRTAISKDDWARIYAAHQGTDRPAFIEQVAGAPGRQQFEATTARQAELADLQRAIDDAVTGRSPEQLINLIHNAASTSKGPTNLNALDMILQGLNTGQREQAGGGVLANILNKAQVAGPAGQVTNPAGVAKAIDALTPAGRGGLFPPASPLGQDVDAMQVLGQRIAAVDRFANRGSAASLGERMAVPALGGSGLGLGAIAHALNMPPQISWPAVLAGVAALANQGIKHMTQPGFAQYGAHPAVVEGANRLGYTAGRAAGDYFTPTMK